MVCHVPRTYRHSPQVDEIMATYYRTSAIQSSTPPLPALRYSAIFTTNFIFQRALHFLILCKATAKEREKWSPLMNCIVLSVRPNYIYIRH